MKEQLTEYYQASIDALTSQTFYTQLGAIVGIYLVAFIVAKLIRNKIAFLSDVPPDSAHTLKQLGYKLGESVFPLFAITGLNVTSGLAKGYEYPFWLIEVASVVALLLFVHSLITIFVTSPTAKTLLRFIALPILFFYLLGILDPITVVLDGIQINIGNIQVSAYGIARVLVFGSLLFYLGRASNNVGKDIIRNQQSLDLTTKEVFTKIFEVVLFCVMFILLLNIMGINLTALAVFGGAVGVGLGLGLQSIASNFISGIIILLDRSLTVGDYVELDDGNKGFVRTFKMRYTVLETYDGKDILVPNEKFINSLMINWTHKDPKQRYRVDFSVAYKTDIRKLCELIKAAVAEHPQVISGADIPFEERPDCEIDSFGDSGVNMFVEFWMEGIDDGKNRVGGDLLLTIFETLKDNNIEIPFPQREVRVLNTSDYFQSKNY